MRSAILLIGLTLIGCEPAALPYPWFEAEWVSDRDSTYEANESFLEQSPEQLEDILSKFGELRWRIEGFTIEAIYPNEPRFDIESAFRIEPIDANSFHLLIESGTQLMISGDSGGFCATPSIENQTIECFVPHGS